MAGPPSDLWKRVAVLDKCCTFKLESFRPLVGAEGDVRRWRATIIPHRQPPRVDPVVSEGADGPEALTRAVERAEFLRWGEG